jgi:hypothetical protein
MPSFSPMVGSDDAARVHRGSQGASFKQTVLERLAEVAKREELLAQYKAKYGGEGGEKTGSSGGNNMGGSDASKKAGAKQAMRATRVDIDARKAVEILPPESSGKEEEEGVKGAGGTSPAMPASSSKPGSAGSANNSSTRTMTPKSKAAPTKAPGGWPWNATTVEGILSKQLRPIPKPSLIRIPAVMLRSDMTRSLIEHVLASQLIAESSDILRCSRMQMYKMLCCTPSIEEKNQNLSSPLP